MIVDASVLLSAFFPDESQAHAQSILRQHAAGWEQLKAPTLIVYEVTNAIWQAERRDGFPVGRRRKSCKRFRDWVSNCSH